MPSYKGIISTLAAILFVVVIFGIVYILKTDRDNSENSSSDSISSTTSTTTTTTATTTTTETTTQTTTTTQATTTFERDPEIDDLIGDVEKDNEWALFLINTDNPLPDDFNLETTYIENDRSLDSKVAPYYLVMQRAAKRDGLDLLLIGGYRTIEHQRYNYNNRVNQLMEQGHSYDEAYRLAGLEYALPGCSEHNGGVAADITGNAWYWNNMSNLLGFDQTPEFDWLIENCYKYGFILRYPEGTTDITGIMYEAWHYRFVGVYHATKITELGITLEEYIATLEN